MALGRWQATIVDEAGNILPGAEVTVRREVGGAPLASIFSDRDGSVPLGNPFTADASTAFAAFHVAGGAYRIDVVSGSFSTTWRYVGVGLAQESDAIPLFQGSEDQVAAAPTDLVLLLDASDSNNPKLSAASTIGTGRQTIWIPAGAMRSQTAGAGPSVGAVTAGDTEIDTLDYDASILEDANFSIAMPKGWSVSSNLFYQAYWSHAGSAGNNVLWNMYAKPYSNDDAINGMGFSDLGSSLDTALASGDLHVSPESAGAVVSGAAEGDLVNFIVRRNASNGSDTFASDAKLIGVKLIYITNANTDD